MFNHTVPFGVRKTAFKHVQLVKHDKEISRFGANGSGIPNEVLLVLLNTRSSADAHKPARRV